MDKTSSEYMAEIRSSKEFLEKRLATLLLLDAFETKEMPRDEFIDCITVLMSADSARCILSMPMVIVH